MKRVMIEVWSEDDEHSFSREFDDIKLNLAWGMKQNVLERANVIQNEKGRKEYDSGYKFEVKND